MSSRTATVWSGLGLALLYAGITLYILLVIEPRLLYEGFGVISDYPVFAAEWSFALRHLLQPAGALRYAAAFLAHSFNVPWLGALLFTGLLAALQAGLWTFAQRTFGIRAFLTSQVPSMLLLAALGRYQFPLADGLALSVAAWCGCLYACAAGGKAWKRWILCVSLLAALYHLVGAASHLFVLMVAVYELARKRVTWEASLYLAIGVGMPWLMGARVYDLTVADSCLLMLPFAPNADAAETGILRTLYLAIPVVVLLPGLAARFLRGNPRKRTLQRFRLLQLMRLPVAATLYVTAASLSFDGHAKSAHRMLFFSRHRLWDRQLELVRNTPPEHYGRYCNHELDRALYHTGRLGYDLFAYRQRMGALLLFRLDDHTAWKWSRVSELALELGDLAFAEKMAFEVMENKGPSPATLKTLALVNAAKGQMTTARVFLKALGKDPVQGKYAKDMLARLAGDPHLDRCGDVINLRRLTIKGKGSLSLGIGEETFLLELVQSEPTNRMALEYLMAFYLLTRQIDKVAANIGRLPACGYREIPTLYEEAILLHQLASRSRINLHGLRIKPATQERFGRYYQVASRCGRDMTALRRQLAPEFGRSFFFYFHFFESGVGG